MAQTEIGGFGSKNLPQQLNQTWSFMKRCFWVFLLFVITLVINAHRVSHPQNDTTLIVQNCTTDPYLASSQADGIIGSWNLVLQAFDENNNGNLDEAERKKGNIGKHFYQFNTDGTCLIHTLKLKGHYELKKVDGKKRLYTYVDEEGTSIPENKWYIISVSKTEMVLLSQDKYAFWIYERL